MERAVVGHRRKGTAVLSGAVDGGADGAGFEHGAEGASVGRDGSENVLGQLHEAEGADVQIAGAASACERAAGLSAGVVVGDDDGDGSEGVVSFKGADRLG